MDPGQVVWLPGSGWDESAMDSACNQAYSGTHACGGEDFGFVTEVYCCY
jgi:hypothetical protein